ncbi:hypothetical protein F5X98DRAFT_369138 [Xylaria grammica]|nr:hypothetical protein F5X98DRAFT_369138 [Xylaria grammica]
MSDTAIEGGNATVVKELWDKVSLQIDDNCRFIKLETTALDSLSARGENYFIYRCSLLLGKPAEFVSDGQDTQIVYLGDPADMQKALDLDLSRRPGDRFPVLRHREPV